MSICIFYGSSTGTTEGIANTIASKLGISNIFDATKFTAEAAAEYDVLLLGTSTWGSGELQDDWADKEDVLKSLDLTGKKVALFGCGDASMMSETFCNGMGHIYQALKNSHCTFLGNDVDASDYTFDDSISVVEGKFVGLALDETNESDKTEDRINAWVEKVKEGLK